MYYECGECQVVLDTEKSPFICPKCGLAGVRFATIDELAVLKHIKEGDGHPIEFHAKPWHLPAPRGGLSARH